MTIEALDASHDTSEFDSGASELDRWLREHGLLAQQRDTARVFVIADDEKRVLAYCAVVVGTVSRDELSSRARSGLPDRVPCLLLGKLAVNKTASRQGHGFELFKHAARIGVQVNQIAAARLLVAEARDDSARDWYVKQGMKCLVDGRTCYLRLADLR